MNNAWKMPKWPVCVTAAALAACTGPAQTNDVAEANAVAETNAAAEVAAEPAPPPAGNQVTAEPAPAPSAKTDPAPAAARESYYALGQEPGWALKIAGGRLDYSGNYGDKKINVARPDPSPGTNGRRYVTARLTVDITYSRCNDAMSGFGFEHQVTVIADGETYKGCGGARKTDWDL